MDVIGAGFGRTGTLATKFALDWLGLGPCHHLHELLRYPEQVPSWAALAHGSTPDWPALLDGYRSTMDWPSAVFWRELVDEYPKARVVLTVREPDRWYDSVHKTLYRQYLEAAGSADARHVQLAEATRVLVWDRIFGGRFADRAHATDVFRAHVADVVAYVPSDRLLVYDVADGWGPLCEFLDVLPPDGPFPRA